MGRDKIDNPLDDIERGQWSEKNEDIEMDTLASNQPEKKSSKQKKKKKITAAPDTPSIIALRKEQIRLQKYAESTRKSGRFNRAAVNAQLMSGFGTGVGFLSEAPAYGTLTTGVIVFGVSASSFFKNSAKLCIPPMNYSTHTIVGLAMSLLGMFLGTSLAALSVTSLALEKDASVELALKVAYTVTACFVLYQKFLYKKDKESTPTRYTEPQP